jgi:hypothetical protein
MTNSSGSEFGNTQAITHMLDNMRKGKLEMTHGKNHIEIGKKLGEGGTKTIYEAVIEGNPFALAVPNTVDGAERMTQKWKVALQEPKNTEEIRSLGIFTNPTCETLPVDINGVPFIVIKMTRYQDLSFQIMDGKNPTSSTVKNEVLPKQLNDTRYEEYFSSIIPDLQTLIKNGVRVGRDSINICIVDGHPRIYLSDVGNAKFEPFPEKTIPEIVEKYVIYAQGAFLNSLTETEFQKHKTFFDSEIFDFNNPDNMNHKIIDKLLKGTSHTEVS